MSKSSSRHQCVEDFESIYISISSHFVYEKIISSLSTMEDFSQDSGIVKICAISIRLCFGEGGRSFEFGQEICEHQMGSRTRSISGYAEQVQQHFAQCWIFGISKQCHRIVSKIDHSKDQNQIVVEKKKTLLLKTSTSSIFNGVVPSVSCENTESHESGSFFW